MDRLYYSISQVAELLSESTSLVRFWSNSFPSLIRPRRNAKGNRLFTQEDVENLRKIHYFVKEKGMTLEGAAKAMSVDNGGTDKKMKAIEHLKNLRDTLVKIRSEL